MPLTIRKLTPQAEPDDDFVTVGAVPTTAPRPQATAADDDFVTVRPRLTIRKVGADETTTQAPARNWLDSIGDTLKGAWNVANPVQMVTGAMDAAASPVQTIKNVGAAQGERFTKAEAAFKRGDYISGVRHAMEYLIPVVGPQIGHAGDLAEEGKLAEGIGEAAAVGVLNAGVPKLSGRTLGTQVRPLKAGSVAERAAVRFGLDEGVPVDVGTASNSPFVRGVQALNEHTSPSASMVRGRSHLAQSDAMQGLGGRLADRAHPTAISPEQAGTSVNTAVNAAIDTLKAQADVDYGAFRTAATDAKNVRSVQQGMKPVTVNGKTQLVADMEDVATPVDMRGIKASLRPVYEEMRKWMEPAKRNASAGFTAIESILRGKDYIPATSAEQGLSGLKTLSMGAESASLRTVSQGTAAGVVKSLQGAIDNAVQTTAGKPALDALKQGRKTHATKMQYAETLNALRDEPVQVFAQTTWAKDAGVARLREIAKIAPGELPKIGRAYLDSLLDRMQSGGGLEHTQAILSQWEKLGPATKSLLFKNPGHVADLDKFFLLAKKLRENPNPSGSALVGAVVPRGALVVVHPITGVPLELAGYALAKALRSPKAAKALTQGMTMRVRAGNVPTVTTLFNAIVRAADLGDDQLVPVPVGSHAPADTGRQ